MGDVISLDAHRPDPHLRGECRCLACDHDFVAVARVGTRWLECPSCHLTRATWNKPVASRGKQRWVCRCGGVLFELTEVSLTCATCGHEAAGWYYGQDPDPPQPPKPRAA